MAVNEDTNPHDAALTGYWSGLHSAWMLFQKAVRGEHSLEEVVDSLGEIERTFRPLADEETVRETIESSEKILAGVDPIDLLREALGDNQELLAEFDAFVAEQNADENTKGEIKLG